MINFLKENQLRIFAFALAIGVIGAIYTFSGDKLGGRSGGNLPEFEEPAITSTTTSATENKLVLNNNSGRKYSLIVNDSDTVIYLYPDDFASASAASNTLMGNLGIRLNANGGSYEINYNNMYRGQLWLATTTANKKVLILDK
jgi:hypothetical protein